MIDRPHASFLLSAVRIGRTDLGAGQAMLDDDALTVLARAADDRPIRIALATITSIVVNANDLTLALADGTRLSIATDKAAQLGEELLARGRALPELTRALRAFGSRRGHRGNRSTALHEQQQFFSPLLEARRRAISAKTPAATIGAFDSAVLTREIEAAILTLARERYAEAGPAQRALVAELSDRAQPLFDALEALGSVAAEATAAVDDLGRWRRWEFQLRATFETADRVWMAVNVALDTIPWLS